MGDQWRSIMSDQNACASPVANRRRSKMNRLVALVVAAGILAVGFAISPAFAEPSQKGQTCRMEQQCKWVNFKKICTWVKVCR
jgi:hypothetical protein